MEQLNEIIAQIDDFVWGPVMLVLLVGTGIFLTFRTRFLTWRNLGYALKSTLSKEARTKSRGEGDVSPFSALTTALAATIGTGNIVGVATAMVSGGPGALVWMWISAAFGLTSKFSECMLAIKYREINAKGEMSGGPMYTMKKGLKNKTFGAVLAWLFALFAVIASFGIGNMTQGNSIAGALHSTFSVPTWVTGIVITVVSLLIIVGGIKSISKVSSIPIIIWKTSNESAPRSSTNFLSSVISFLSRFNTSAIMSLIFSNSMFILLFTFIVHSLYYSADFS